VPRWAKKDGGTLLHIAGEGGEGRLKTMLEAAGFDVRMEILYGTEAIESLPPHALSALAENRLDAVAVFSPRSASILAALIYKSGIEESCAPLISIAISQRASDSLGALPFRERRVAAQPNQDAMLAAISA
jgi:uroporphyrinogen-III synthase